MKVLDPFVSECSLEVNAKILDAIEEVVCEYRSFLPDGWRVIIEMIRNDDKESLYYHLDLQSNKGGGDNALIRASNDGDGLIVPYDILVTEIAESEDLCLHRNPQQIVRNTKGHVSIAFDGAADTQLNSFFEFWIFKRVQKILKRYWTMDQIWWNLRGFDKNIFAQFWIKHLKIKEVCK